MSISNQELLQHPENISESPHISAPRFTYFSLPNLWREFVICRNTRTNRPRSRHSRNASPRHIYLGQKERNIAASFCSLFCIIILCIALYEPYWIYISGGGCDGQYVGAKQFFYNGHFTIRANSESAYSRNSQDLVYHFGPGKVMVNCVTELAVKLMKLIICLCLIGILVSLFGCLLDLFGTRNKMLSIIRRNALPSIFTAILCVVTTGFCYWVTVEVASLQAVTRPHHSSKVSVSFGLSFYLLAAAGAVTVVSTAFNCLHRRHRRVDNRIETLMNDHDRLLSEGPCIDASSTEPLPLPPAYSP